MLDFQLIRREFIAGGTAGGIGIFLGFPVDLIKVNLQTNPDKFKSAVQCFRHIVKTEGYKGLYKGFLPPVLMQGMRVPCFCEFQFHSFS
jgi:solute carrier family 25 (mitochondrial carnitine/acylcarnitine transporter), member 20/29